MGLSKRRHACAFDSDRGASSKRNRKIITDDEIVEYVANKVLKAAKKIKSRYSNESKPFGDANLNTTFVWRKKIEKDIAQGASYSIKTENRRQREIMAEIKKVKKRKEERAIEKAQREEEMALLKRERAGAEFQGWKKKEEEFCFDQSKKRSEIRLREGRIKPIDILMTKHLDIPSDHDFGIDINEPAYMVFKGLTVKEMQELHDDIKMHLDLDRANTRYWDALLVVCEWELAEVLRKRDTSLEHARVCGLHASVETEVQTLLRGKSYAELETLQSQIESQMQSGAAKEVEYWEAVLKRLHICKAKACLKDIQAKMLRARLQRPLEVHDEDLDGSYSPQLQHSEEDEDAIDPEEDNAILERKRIAVLEERAAASKPIPPEDNNDLEKSAFKAMGGALEEGDAVFGSNNEVNLDSKVYYSWHDKYRPRKPKYFNRVHTGYEWNKYNQNHYDHDNPPPKMVQGYKFSIFYPDLLDKIKAPTYAIEKDGDETCIIRFHAGPPYEDIAFRIVNKKWDYSHKKGFKCTFERGILQVYFNFKRYPYRR